MSEDSYRTQPSGTVDPLEAKVLVFRQQPEAKGFAALRQELRDAGRGELLAELCATWAQHERDPHRAADAWSEAGEAMAVLGETATAIEYLRTVLELDPSNDRAADRLLEIVEPNDPAAAAEIIETELTELAKRDGKGKKSDVTARRASHHRRAAVLWNDHLGRVDRALWHWQQAWKLEPQRTEARFSLYEHCARAIDRSLGVGAHGLPLMGGGDWNDGMNRVGYRGTGESVWLGWFQCAVLPRFAAIALTRGDRARIPNESSNSMAVPAAGPTPGSTPIRVPTKHPRMVIRRYCH